MDGKISHSPYILCPECHEVVCDPEHKLTRLDEPAPCCGSSGKIRISWPLGEVDEMLKTVNNQDLNCINQRRIAIVFLCTALEMLLENVLWDLLAIHTKSIRLAEAIFDGYKGRRKAIELYNKLSDCKIAALLEKKGFNDFFNEWEKLAKLRNDIVHGHYSRKEPNEVILIRNVYEKCLAVFAEVHNDVKRQRTAT